jgi:hypothetical protein
MLAGVVRVPGNGHPYPIYRASLLSRVFASRDDVSQAHPRIVTNHNIKATMATQQ